MEKKTCGECKHYNKRHMFCHKKGFKWLCDDDKACEDFQPIPKPTNGDMIRAWTNSELAEMLAFHSMCKYCPAQSADCGKGSDVAKCRKAWTNWLDQEAKK